MIAPSAKKIIDIDVNCSCSIANCSDCTRAIIYYKRRWNMTPDNFAKSCESLRYWTELPAVKHGWVEGHRVIAMIGGTPTMHPKFEELCKIFRETIPRKEARGLWTNSFNGYGTLIAETFGHFNLNVHGDEQAAAEMRRSVSWNILGSAPNPRQSMHAGQFTAIQDFIGSPEIPDEAAMWEKIEACDVNRFWSGSIFPFDMPDGSQEIRGYFCEIAGVFEALQADRDRAEGKDEWGPKHGQIIVPGWWRLGMEYPSFAAQHKKHCRTCGFPLKLRGHQDDERADDVSKTHAHLIQIGTKRKQRMIMHEKLPDDRVIETTDYQRQRTPAHAVVNVGGNGNGDGEVAVINRTIPIADPSRARAVTDWASKPESIAAESQAIAGILNSLITEKIDKEIREATNPIRLNLGAGDLPIEGFTPVDRKRAGGEVFPIAVPLAQGGLWNPPDNSVDEIRASHILEHFPHRHTMDVLREWVRALKPGGRIRIAVPDFRKCATMFLQGQKFGVDGVLYGGQTDENDFHKAAFTEEALREGMYAAGLCRVRPWKSEVGDCASLPISLNLEGCKAYPIARLPDGAEQCVMSQPRLGFTAHSRCAMDAFGPLNVNVRICEGVSWDQVLTQGILASIGDNVKYVATTDYDSIYKPHHVHELYRLMEENPHVDAIVPLQIRRDCDLPLFMLRGEDGKIRDSFKPEELHVDLVPVDSGNFGLSILRTSAFAKLPKPWFRSEPGPDGHWGEGRTDSDVAFWRQWTAAGNTLFCAPHVSIGHIRTEVVWLDANNRPYRQSTQEWLRDGIPGQVQR